MRKPFVAGNWKMNGNRKTIKVLLDGLLSGIADVSKAEVAVCAPYVYLPEVESQLNQSAIKWGAQDIAKEESGAFTGEVSGQMLNDFGCHYAIIGHSERRAYYGDTDDVVAEKMSACLRDGLTPILCVGETLDEREANITEQVVERQLEAAFAAVGVDGFSKAVIAYEPVWAIGTGKTASPQQAQDVHAFIRHWLSAKDEGMAEGVQILYGGSVKANNAAELFSQTDIDGGLIGGASLDATEFLNICKSA